MPRKEMGVGESKEKEKEMRCNFGVWRMAYIQRERA